MGMERFVDMAVSQCFYRVSLREVKIRPSL